MAKTPAPAAAAIATVSVGKFTFDTGFAIPTAARTAAKQSDDAEKLMAMPIGASFLEAVTVPDTVTDPAEREKTFKEKAKGVTNRLSGLTRRFAKKNAGYAFALRTVNDDQMGRGVRVFRIEPEPVAGAPTPTATEGSTAPASA